MAGQVMDMTKIAQDHQARTDRVIQACAAPMAMSQHYSDEAMIKCLVAACYELAAIWREEATAAMEANRKGCKTQADQLRESAARISAFAVAAHKYGLPEGPLSEVDPETVVVTDAAVRAVSNGAKMAAGEVSNATVMFIHADGPVEESLAEAAESIIKRVRENTPNELAKAFTISESPAGPIETNSAGQEGVPMAWTSPADDPFSSPFPQPVIQAINEPIEASPARCDCGSGVWHDRSEICAPEVGDKQQVAGIDFTKIGKLPEPWSTKFAKEGEPFPSKLNTPDVSAFLKGETNTLPAEWTRGRSPDVILQDDPFSVAEEKTWSQRMAAKMPELEVFQIGAAPKLPSPGHTSVSQANRAGGCGMSWWLKYRMGAPELPSWAMIGGSALHGCIEQIERDFAAGVVPTGDIKVLWFERFGAEIKSKLDSSPFPIETWHASRQGKEDRAWWDADGPEMVHRYLEWRAAFVAQGWSLLRTSDGTPVIEFEINYHGTKGFIDSAWVRGNDVMIIDPKSGSSKQADYFQLTTYAIALLNLGLLKAGGKVLGAFWDARSGQLSKIADLTQRHTIAEVTMRLEAPKRMDAAGLYMPNVNGGYGGCGSCSLKRSCPVGSRIGIGEVDG